MATQSVWFFVSDYIEGLSNCDSSYVDSTSLIFHNEFFSLVLFFFCFIFVFIFLENTLFFDDRLSLFDHDFLRLFLFANNIRDSFLHHLRSTDQNSTAGNSVDCHLTVSKFPDSFRKHGTSDGRLIGNSLERRRFEHRVIGTERFKSLLNARSDWR